MTQLRSLQDLESLDDASLQDTETPGAAPEGADAASEAGPDAEKAGLTKLAELLEQDEETSPEGDSEAAAGAAKNAKPVRFNDLAEATGLELDELYKLQVTTNEGEALTIEELKARAVEQQKHVVDRLEWQEQKARQEREILKAEREIADIIRSLPEKALKPETIQRIRQRANDQMTRERQLTLQAIPAWQDEDKRGEEIAALGEYLEGYGFAPDHLGQVVDHRMINFIRQSYLREERIKNALAKVKAGKPNPTPPSKPVGKAPSKATPRTTPRNVGNKLEAFFSDLE